jgi:hypothetical protein
MKLRKNGAFFVLVIPGKQLEINLKDQLFYENKFWFRDKRDPESY